MLGFEPASIILVVFCLIALLIVMSFIPGLEYLTKPLAELMGAALKASLEHLSLWVIFLIKSLWWAHATFLENLIKSAEDIDPTYHLRK